jgi:tetratricopeptide (TPR) repeat protein
MRRALILVLLAAALVLGAVFLLRRTAPVWTTSSPAALVEFEQGLEAEAKFYHAEALAHYQRAAELDPEFAMAKLKQLALTSYSDKDEIERLAGELRAANTDQLTERERFLITHRLARMDKQNARAQKLLTAYVAEHPQDPFALSILCDYAWTRLDWPEAESCYRRLLKIDPNWVNAQNHLGYSAMAQGRFREAEELFRTYLFIAPDQANPHDSLGEMLTLLGRYPEAEQELNEAVRVKPDFCPAWQHLLTLDLDQQRFAPARARLAQITELGVCEPAWVANEGCRIALRESLTRGDFDAAWQASSSPECQSRPEELSILRYRAALGGGRLDEARAMAATVDEQSARFAKEEPFLIALGAHMAGLRLLAEGDAPGAVAELRKADERLVYWGNGQGSFKLLNRLDLAAALRAAGEAEAAAAMVEQVRAINPAIAERDALRPGPLAL